MSKPRYVVAVHTDGRSSEVVKAVPDGYQIFGLYDERGALDVFIACRAYTAAPEHLEWCEAMVQEYREAVQRHQSTLMHEKRLRELEDNAPT